MVKIFFLLAIILGALWYFPESREVMKEVAAPVLNPVLTWQTKGEMDRIGRELESLQRQGAHLPTPGEHFQGWMNRNFLGGSRADAWGQDYTMRVWRDSIGVLSSGPDMTLDTSDDIVLALQIRMEVPRR